jgi:hypothetical protein
MDEPTTMQFEDVALDEARRMGRGPRMEPILYATLRNKIRSLSDQAARMRLGPEITPQRMKRYLLHIARELQVPVTVRRVPGGVIFWRSTDEDIQQATEVGARLQTTRQKSHARPQGHRPRTTR